MGFVADSSKSRFTPDSPASRFTPDHPVNTDNSLKPSMMQSGMMARGADAVSKGISARDIPGVGFRVLSDMAAGAPKSIAERPRAFAMGGLPGVGISILQKPEASQIPYPKPVTAGGRQLAGDLGTTASLIPAEMVTRAPMEATGEALTAGKNWLYPKGRDVIAKGQDLASELLARGQEGVDVAGATQGGYTMANADVPVDEGKLKDILSKIPKGAQEEIANNPEIARKVGGMYGDGANEIEANLGNSAKIRRVLGGKVPSRYFDLSYADQAAKEGAQAGYRDIGNVMTENDPVLNEAMQNYAKTKQGQGALEDALLSKQGYTKGARVLKMFSNNPNSATAGLGDQAVEALAENNPEVSDTVRKIKDYANYLEKAKKARQLLKWGAVASGGGALAGEGLNLAHHKNW